MLRSVPRHAAALRMIALALCFLLGSAAAAAAQEVIPIALIRSNPTAYINTFVTVQGQVTIPSNYLPFDAASGWIQDDSGRGIYLFGSGADNAAFQNVGNIVQLQGEVKVVGSTLGLTNLTSVTTPSSGNPRKTSIQLGTGMASDTSLDGTLLQTNGPVLLSTQSGASRIYDVNDGSGLVKVRVPSVVNSMTFSVGTHITAVGVGSNQEVLVGRGVEVYADTLGTDTTAPTLVGSVASVMRDSVMVTFSESIDPGTAGNTANYEVFETNTPVNTIAVTSATVSGVRTFLQLASATTKGLAYTVRVSNIQDTTGNAMPAPQSLGFTVPVGDTTPPTLVSATNTSDTTVEAMFSENIDPGTGGDAVNYEVFVTASPATTIMVSAAVISGDTATLTLGSPLQPGTGYTVRVQDIEDLDGNALVGAQTATFTTAPDVTSIADIQTNLPAYKNQPVTIQGQIYIPTNYINSRYSGYIQDSSGRGINLFGDSANVPALFNTGNIVTVTGVVDTFFTTVEVVNISNVTLESSGNPPLQPQVLSTSAAASPSWEGTFIQSTGTITSIGTTGGSAPATNYTINDGSGPLVIRVVDDIGAPSFAVGQTITGRGAGAAFQSDFQVLVGSSADVFVDSGGPDTTPPTLVSASGPTATEVAVNFSERVTPGTANVSTNYTVQATGGAALSVTGAMLNGAATGVTLTLGSSMVNGTNYTVTVNNVQDEAGNTIAANSNIAFTYTEFSGTSIADIHANLSAYKNQPVTIQGQIYIPTNYINSRFSGYIQDGSGRGINLFGDSANDAALFDTGNIVTVTGVVDTFFTTIEVVNISSVILVSSGNPPLQPAVLSTGAAASPSWEGTFIQSTGTITNIGTTGGSAPATNYTINDGTGPLVIRVVDDLGIPNFTMGQTITGRGAGGAFQSDFQIHIGRAADIFTGGGGPDTTPPTIASVLGTSETQLSVNWSETVTTTTANVATNYAVYLTSNQSTTFAVTSAVTSGSRTSTTLTLGSPLTDGVNYTVRVSGIEDDAGNTIVANSTRAFVFSSSNATPIADIQSDPAAFEGQVVTVRGQVFIPSNYIASRFSGYIQDDSDRGVNLFGNGANNPALFNTSNIVEVTGTVALFFTTVEIENISSVMLLSSGNPELAPRVLSTGAAASPSWEGTFIQSTGVVTDVGTTGGSAPATNYTINDGTGPVVLRVVDDLNAPTFVEGDRVTGLGAGGAFQSDFQINIGRTADIFLDTGTDTGAQTVSLSGEPYTFIPGLNETYPITVTVPLAIQASSETLLRIFDMTGRLRRTLFDSRFGNLLGVIPWDGRDDRQELVPAGTYIAHLSVVDQKTGSRDERQMAVVVATRLNR